MLDNCLIRMPHFAHRTDKLTLANISGDYD